MANNDGWLARARAKAKAMLTASSAAGDGGFETEIGRAESLMGYDQVSMSHMLGSGKRQARSRAEIYGKYHLMMGEPFISTALRAHATTALGGDEKTGNTVWLDTKTEAGKDTAKTKLVAELRTDLEPFFNRIAHQIAFNAAGFGDAFARVYTKDKQGIVAISTDEMVYPPLVQPYSRGDTSVGYVVATGQKFTERLSIKQLARCKMPRFLYVPQVRVIEKSMRVALREDDVDKLPILPELIGGSFLESVEDAFDDLMATLAGLVGQRILNSIDESMIGVNLEGMTLEQRKTFMDSVKGMLKASKKYAEDAIKRGQPVAERRFHLIPTFGEKQLHNVSPFSGTSGANSISIEDVMFHAKRLAGALGTDLSILGFADILSGGLGDGGFFRTSVQSAERSRIIRSALSGFFNELVDIHTLAKYGWVFEPGDRPYDVAFYGANSAVEAEKQASRERAQNAAAITLTALSQLKELGLGEEANKQFLEKQMDMDEEDAKQIAKALQESMDTGGDGGNGGDMGDEGGGQGGRGGFGASFRR